MGHEHKSILEDHVLEFGQLCNHAHKLKTYAPVDREVWRTLGAGVDGITHFGFDTLDEFVHRKARIVEIFVLHEDTLLIFPNPLPSERLLDASD